MKKFTKEQWGYVVAGSAGWNVITLLHMLPGHRAEPVVLYPFDFFFFVLMIYALYKTTKDDDAVHPSE